MKSLEVKATVPANAAKGTKELSATIKVEAPETCQEAEEMYGGEAVLTNSISNWVITLQSNIRNALKRGETQDDIQDRLAGAKMGVAQAGVRVDPIQAYLARFQSATPEMQAQMLADLQARAAQ